MANKKKLLPIGTKGYAVNKHYVDHDQKEGARVIPCKLVTYSNEGRKIYARYESTLRGVKAQFTKQNHYIYPTLEEAVSAIQSE